MKKNLFPFIACLFLSLPAVLAAGKLQMTLESFPYMNQLPSNSVQRVFQDREGYIWFGTLDGLCRFDAYHVKSFRSNMLDPYLLTNNDIFCMEEDADNHLWIGTKQGLNILDKGTFRITPFELGNLQNIRINCMVRDKDGNMWIGSQQGLFLYDTHTKSLRGFAHDEYDQKTVQGNSITSIYRDRQDRIWVLCWDGGLSLYDYRTDRFRRFPKMGTSNNPFRMLQDKRNRYWICSWGEGLWQFDPAAPASAMFRRVSINGGKSTNADNTAYSIVQDDKYGYLWVMTLTGLNVLDVKPDGAIETIDIRTYLQGSSKNFSEIIKDKEGNLWIGAFSEGAYIINFNSPPVGNYTLDKVRQKLGYPSSIKTMCVDDEGLVWLGLNRIGLCLYDRNRNEPRMQSEMPGLSGLTQLYTINTIRYIRSRKEFWLTANDSVVLVIRKNGNGVALDRIIPIRDQVDGRSDYTSGDKNLYEDKGGNVWIGTAGGVFKVSRNGSVRFIESIPSVTDISQDKAGNIWISSEKTGLTRLSPGGNRYRITTFDKYTKDFNTSNVQAVLGHSDGKIWIGSKDGRLMNWDPATGQFTDVSNLCAMTGEAILNIIEDKKGNLWISTNKKVTRFNPRSKTSTYYSVLDNLAVNSFIEGAWAISPGGEVLFGGNKGFCSFSSSREVQTPKVSHHRVFITDVKVHNQSVYELESDVRFDNLKNKLVINHTEKNIEIEFSTLNYTSPGKIQYAYKLEGVDNDWNFVGNSRRFATYNNLHRGKFKLRLKATDENGVWSDEITTLLIVKKPAFYETWWAFLFYLALLGFFGYSFYKYSLNRLRLRQELNIARIDKEKTEELAQIKLRYFTNISHELLTPLTIISCLIDDLEVSLKGKFWQHEVMRVNVSRLKRLLQQILDFRKVESGNMRLKVSEGDLVAFLQHICTFNFNPLATEKHIHFSFLSSDVVLNGWFDHDKVDTVIFNLLSNAFKYTPKGGSVHVNLDKVYKGSNSWARILVTDTGRGIAPEDLEHIFTRFYSNDPTNTVENHGIGLTLTKELLELHHASIRVESEPGRGSSFVVELPLDGEYYEPEERSEQRPSVLPEISDEELPYLNEPNEATQPEDVHLLIVEDNNQLRSFMERLFSKKYHTYTAENGLQALKVIEEQPVEIVLSDIVMPEMDGLELCRRIKNKLDTSHIEVLLLTAKNSIDDRIESYNAGADGYLSKPFELKVLEARISSLVRNRRHKTDQFKSNFDLNISSMEFTSLDEKFLESAVAVIEEHLSEPDFDLDTFSGKLNMSKSSLYRKMKSLTQLSPVEFTKNIRLKHACQMLRNQQGNISDVAYSVGFADPKYFTSCFKAEFGMTPTEYLKRNREGEAEIPEKA